MKKKSKKPAKPIAKPSTASLEVVKLINSLIAIRYLNNTDNEAKLALALDKLAKRRNTPL